ncbi:outer membrane lipoprotein-sorting protein [Mycetocola sp. CAN_C7]|uniref:LolA family protein n=1 Tax=Mycetocola sp. CAN_C7 TaxID=2787724 RepID=UPI0018CB5611
MSRKSLRWLPAVVVPGVIAVAIVAVPLQAGASVDLPDKTADEVLQLIGESTEDSFSGTVEKTAALGLPTLPDGIGGGSESSDAGLVGTALELSSGTQEARVSADGPLNLRVQTKDVLAERNLISNGTDAWFYDSETNVATHVAIPADVTSAITDKLDAASALATPAEVADRVIDELGDSTDFAVGTDSTVAGRTVYELILTPKASGTLAESISISVDSETGLPLQVSVAASGQNEPALEVGFTAIDFATPSADLFTFAPGDGVTVEETPFPSAPEHSEPPTEPDAGDRPVVTGTGWAAIVELPAGTVPDDVSSNPLFAELTTEVDGGRLLSTALVNVLLTDDGRVLAGSVAVERLQAAAGVN